MNKDQEIQGILNSIIATKRPRIMDYNLMEKWKGPSPSRPFCKTKDMLVLAYSSGEVVTKNEGSSPLSSQPPCPRILPYQEWNVFVLVLSMVTHSSDGNISYKDQLYMKITQIILISLMLPLQCKILHDSTIFCKILKEKCTVNFSWLTQTPNLDNSTSLVVNGQ